MRPMVPNLKLALLRRISAAIAPFLLVPSVMVSLPLYASGGPQPSNFISDESVQIAAQYQQQKQRINQQQAERCGLARDMKIAQMAAYRQCKASVYYQSNLYQRLREQYPVTLETKKVGGVPVEWFTPINKTSARDNSRVLINLGGGAFQYYARVASHLESIPIASLSQIDVVSIDYRRAPEHRFPAATEDVVAVYRALLKQYRADRIGIYGCSSGAMLTAQTLVALVQADLPLPAAAGLFCGAAAPIDRGDSPAMVGALYDRPIKAFNERLYFEQANASDPNVFPALSAALLQQFPPTLLVTSTRDHLMSSAITTHRQLRQAGVEADLHVWEGMPHAFLWNTALPESQQAFATIVEFFTQRLGNASSQ